MLQRRSSLYPRSEERIIDMRGGGGGGGGSYSSRLCVS